MTTATKIDYTAGPWFIEDLPSMPNNKFYAFEITHEHGEVGEYSTTKGIAAAIANAKLIAAAPELLDALEELEEYVRRECTLIHGLSEAEINIITGKALAAIKKATE